MASTSYRVTAVPPIRRLAPGESLNRDDFRQSISVLGLKIPASRTTEFMKYLKLKGSLLQLPKVKTVEQVEGEDDTRILLLDFYSTDSLPEDISEIVKRNQLDVVPHPVELDYSYWTAEEVLKSTLPESLLEDMPTAFTMMGHLAHVNLREEYLPYKYLFGQVILDKNKGLRSVVNKTDNIDTTFRFFKMETIAGETDTMVEVNESGCTFRFDFAKVYWNSRLGTEHERLVSIFQPNDLIADVFAGVGPFAIPAARNNCLVFANDLNPASAEYLAQNCQENRVQERVRVTNLDGREFIKSSVLEAIDRPFVNVRPIQSSKQRARQARLKQTVKEEPVQRAIAHYVMNLPALALEFLDAFPDAFRPSERSKDIKEVYGARGMPMVQCHCFTRELDPQQAEADILERAQRSLGHPISSPSFHYVRRVAPNKDMYCMSFRLPSTILD
ncbi:tRNA(m(1)G37)methyltransferase [Serendipita sp. 399]|nr:tRNA(m(1)G37)methyltransferase [Serendipita sp. 399]